MKRIAALILLLLLMAGLALPVCAAGSDIRLGVELTAASAYVVNENTGKVVFAKKENERRAPASTTKIMTSALAMELCADLDGTIVTVPYGIWNEFDGIDISNAGLAGGEELSMRDLIACMLVQSANEAASVVADYFGRDYFLSLMNSKAKELGCTNTHFVNPHGLDDPDHYTSAKDLYLITRWAMSHEGFMEIASSNYWTLPETDWHDERDLVSTNRMQEPTSGYYTSYIRGIKTGTTDAAGRCLVTSAEKDGMTYVAVLLGCPEDVDARIWEEGNSSYTDTRLLYDWCFDNLSISRVADPGTPISEIPLKYAAHKDYLILYSSGDIRTLLDDNREEEPVIRYEAEIPDSVSAPIREGEILGTARVYCDEVYMGTVDLITRESVERSAFVFLMDTVSRILISVPAMILYVAAFFLALAYIYYMKIMLPAKQKQKRSQKERE